MKNCKMAFTIGLVFAVMMLMNMCIRLILILEMI